jgi:hypothetical protein
MEAWQFMIYKIKDSMAAEIIDKRTPLGCFYLCEQGIHVGIDNRTGDAWTEEFGTKDECMDWLNGKFEVGDRG